MYEFLSETCGVSPTRADIDTIAPIVLVDRKHWTESLPVWPLLQSLGRNRAMGRLIHCVDTVAEAVTTVIAAADDGPEPA